jgi:phospholipid/cholesterol/gamma-HCH transport system substrate-binding protein
MRTDRKTEIKVGITTIISLVVFIWIMAWAKNFQFISTDKEINIAFENVSGLELDDDVSVRGLRKGFVQDIYLDKNNIMVKISLDETVDLQTDAQFWITSVDLMGAKKIEIIPGSSSELLDLNVIQRGLFQPDISTMMGTIGSVKDDMLTIVNDVRISLSALNDYLTDDEMMYDLKSSLNNLNSLTNKLDRIIAENSSNIGRITENTAALSEETKIFFNENKESLKSSVTTLNSLMVKSDSLINKFNFLASQTMDGNNNLGRILYDDSLLVNLTESLQALNKLSKLVLLQLQTDGFKVDANIW